MDVAIWEVMSSGGYDLGDCELLDIPDFGGIDLWRLQFFEVSNFGGYGLGVFSTHPFCVRPFVSFTFSSMRCFVSHFFLVFFRAYTRVVQNRRYIEGIT